MREASNHLVVRVLPGSFAVARLAPGAEVHAPASGGFWSLTRTPEETSIVCAVADVPPDAHSEGPFRLLGVDGPLPFEATGILAALAAPLAAAGVPILALATHDTDYLLVPERRLEDAAAALRGAGHEVIAPARPC